MSSVSFRFTSKHQYFQNGKQASLSTLNKAKIFVTMGNNVQKKSLYIKSSNCYTDKFHGGVAYEDMHGHRSIVYEATRQTAYLAWYSIRLGQGFYSRLTDLAWSSTAWGHADCLVAWFAGHNKTQQQLHRFLHKIERDWNSCRFLDLYSERGRGFQCRPANCYRSSFSCFPSVSPKPMTEKNGNFTRFALYLTYLLTYPMEQSPSWEANWFCS